MPGCQPAPPPFGGPIAAGRRGAPEEPRGAAAKPIPVVRTASATTSVLRIGIRIGRSGIAFELYGLSPRDQRGRSLRRTAGSLGLLLAACICTPALGAPPGRIAARAKPHTVSYKEPVRIRGHATRS